MGMQHSNEKAYRTVVKGVYMTRIESREAFTPDQDKIVFDAMPGAGLCFAFHIFLNHITREVSAYENWPGVGAGELIATIDEPDVLTLALSGESVRYDPENGTPAEVLVPTAKYEGLTVSGIPVTPIESIP